MFVLKYQLSDQSGERLSLRASLWLTGVQHIMDNIVKGVTGGLLWFPTWLEEARALIKFLRAHDARETLRIAGVSISSTSPLVTPLQRSAIVTGPTVAFYWL